MIKYLQKWKLRIFGKMNTLTKTNDYKVSIHNPWCPYGTIIKADDRDELLDYEEYPDIFFPIYKFETGEEIVEGDLVWVVRINGKIKERQFNPKKKYANVFPCYTSAFDYLMESDPVEMALKIIKNNGRSK